MIEPTRPRSDICLAWAERGFFATKRLVICQRSPGHSDSDDPGRRQHYDPDAEQYWTDEELK